VNQGLRGEVLPRSAFCSMQNQNIPSPAAYAVWRGDAHCCSVSIVGAAFPPRAACRSQAQVRSAVWCNPQPWVVSKDRSPTVSYFQNRSVRNHSFFHRL